MHYFTSATDANTCRKTCTPDGDPTRERANEMKLIILTVCVVVLAACCDADTADGPDIRGCMCPRNYSPVCASDGETYDNQCLFECAQKVYRSLRVVRAGTCDNFVESNNPELGNPAI